MFFNSRIGNCLGVSVLLFLIARFAFDVCSIRIDFATFHFATTFDIFPYGIGSILDLDPSIRKVF